MQVSFCCILMLCNREASSYRTKLQTIKVAVCHKSWATLSIFWHPLMSQVDSRIPQISVKIPKQWWLWACPLYTIQAVTALRVVTAWPCDVTSQKTVIGTLIISNWKTLDREHASDMHTSSSRLTDCGNSPDCSCSSTLTNDRAYDLFSCSVWRKSVITSVSTSPNHSLPTFACTATSMKNVCVLLREELRFTVLAFYTMCTSVVNLNNRVCRFRNVDVSQTCFKVAFSSSIYRLRSCIAANLVCCLSSTSRLWWWLRCRLFFQWTTWDVFYSAFQSTFSTLVYSTV